MNNIDQTFRFINAFFFKVCNLKKLKRFPRKIVIISRIFVLPLINRYSNWTYTIESTKQPDVSIRNHDAQIL